MTATIRFEQVLLKVNGWHTYDLPLKRISEPSRVKDFEVDIIIESPSDIDELKTEGYGSLIDSRTVGPRMATVQISAKEFTPKDDLQVRWRTVGGSQEGKMYFGERDGLTYFVHIFDPARPWSSRAPNKTG